MKFVLKDTDEWFGAIFSTALYGGVAGLVLFFVLFFAGGERVGSASNALFEATRAEPLLLWISGAGIAFLFTQKCRDWVFPAEAALQAEQRANERAQFVLAAEAKRSELLAKEKADKDAFSRTMVEIRQKELAESARLEAMQLKLDGWKAMSPFQFEEQVATLFRRLGAKAKVTPKSRDGRTLHHTVGGDQLRRVVCAAVRGCPESVALEDALQSVPARVVVKHRRRSF
jgi:hypothetical protein